MYFYKNIIKKTSNCKCFQSLLFTLDIFYHNLGYIKNVTEVMVHNQLWTKQSNVRTNTKYTKVVTLTVFNTYVAIYCNDLTRTKNMTLKSTENVKKKQK